MNTVEQPRNGLAVGALVCGIIAILGALTLAGPGAVIGSLAIVLGVVARRRDDRRGMAIAGIVTGAVAVVLGVASLIVFVWLGVRLS